MVREPTRRHITRGLRFRLTVSYALFFALSMAAVGFVFHKTLESTLERQTREVLDQEWAAMKGYLRIEEKPLWYFDPLDLDEAFIVGRIRLIYLIADANGKVLEGSDAYESLGIDTPEEIRATLRSQQPVWRVRTSSRNVPFLIRSGLVFDEKHRKPYFVGIGRSLAENQRVMQQFTWLYVSLTPALILLGCLLGWIIAGRALKPVSAVARAAQRISGSNLTLRIPARGAGDELDYLIQTFNRMIDRLENSFRQIRQFSTDVSHELRTPITAIRGQLEVALFTAQNVDQYREAMLNSLQDTERLSQIVRALLLLSQAESGQLALQKTLADLSTLVHDIVDQFQIPAEGAQVKLLADLSPDCTAEVDRVQIERMVSNLISNAIKFTPAGGEVSVKLARREEHLELVVEDTGCGIAAEHLPHIFDRFYRVPAADPTPEKGLGLGLSFVAWIAKAHGGRVDVESTLGKGSRFRILLPAPPTAPASPEMALQHAAADES